MKSKEYIDGYETGLTWKNDYRPGGPWVMSSRHSHNEEFKIKCELSRQASKDYLQGFDDAMKERGIEL